MDKAFNATWIVAVIVFSSVFAGMVLFTDVYEEVLDDIVSVTCLSCIKLQPVTKLEFLFKTANDKPHPDFVLDNLSKGPVFIAYRTKDCTYCDEMDPVLEEVFKIQDVNKQGFVYEEVDFNGNSVFFMHINKSLTSDYIDETQDVYDKDYVYGVPMFTMVTLRYHRGIVEPYYATLYGKIDLSMTNEERAQYLYDLIDNAIDLYNENKAGYK